MIEEYPNVTVLGENLVTFEEPSNRVRWVMRNGEKVLQQCWLARHEDRHGYVTYQEEQWRDVPIEPEQ